MNHRLKLRTLYLFIAISIMVVLSGCGKENTEEQQVVTLADEIANSHDEVVPMEARQYTSIDFLVPKKMEADENNTDTEKYFLSSTAYDCSFIAYGRTDINDALDYSQMDEEDYQEAFAKMLGVPVVIKDFDRQLKDDYYRICITSEYKANDVAFEATEYLYVTDDFIFTLIYNLDTSSDRAEAFKESAETISLISVLKTVSDNEIEGVHYQSIGLPMPGEGKYRYQDVLDELTSGIGSTLSDTED